MAGIASICATAMLLQEFSLEHTLDKMQAEWAGVCFETLPWRATGCTILRAVDDIQQVGDLQVATYIHTCAQQVQASMSSAMVAIRYSSIVLPTTMC